MIETLVSIILLPVAAVAAIITIALGVGVVKAIVDKISSKDSDKN